MPDSAERAQRTSEHLTKGHPMTDKKCNDAEVMRIWRECGLPEYFLGNGGSNHKLVAFAKACASTKQEAGECAITKAIKTMDAIGRDWKADGQMEKFYATNYLVEAIRPLLRCTTTAPGNAMAGGSLCGKMKCRSIATTSARRCAPSWTQPSSPPLPPRKVSRTERGRDRPMSCPYCHGTGWLPSCFESACVCLDPPCNRIRCACNGSNQRPYPPTGDDRRRAATPTTPAPLLDLMAAEGKGDGK